MRSARRSTSVLYSSQLTCRLIASSSIFTGGCTKRILPKNGFLTSRPGRDHRDLRIRQLLDAFEIGACIRGKRIVRLHAERAGLPSWHRFVNRKATRNGVRAGRNAIEPLAVRRVGGADIQRLHAIQHIELGDAESIDAIQLE